jgi:hypothetical protein
VPLPCAASCTKVATAASAAACWEPLSAGRPCLQFPCLMLPFSGVCFWPPASPNPSLTPTPLACPATAQVLGIVCIAAWSCGLSGILFLTLKRLGWLRADKEDEQQGLDLSQGIGTGIRASCFPCMPCCRD